ncbi:alpha/beta fold hydrolase [Agarilytica rhodophyticola]|uniref:alpha/beta fold hydrolase n=1 Tax=Agarilytica rhodophyticola TaxID=1737490 RepID=UPI000B3412D0|nr:alpha/beta hydrolase [Agarilytica rhodophyticola]
MKEPIILLPGMMCDGRLFTPQYVALSAQQPVTVAAITGRASIEALAENILANAPPTFALAGLSMGGIVAMEIIRQAPGRVSRLALMDTNHLPDPPERIAIRERQIQQARQGHLKTIMREEMKPNYLAEGENRDHILDLCMSMAESLGPKVFEQQSRALAKRPDQRETLRHIKVPTLILCGESDRLCNVEKHQIMHNLISHSELVVIPRAGHLPTLEQPELTNKALNRWLRVAT